MAQKPKSAAKKGIGKGVTLSWVIATAIFAFMPAAVFLLVIGMAPTVVAFFIVDRHPAKYISRTVGYLNFAGCLPYMLDLWKETEFWTFDRMVEIISDPISLVVMYSSAAAGWVILYLTPPVVAAYLSVTNEMKEQRFKARQAELIETWGRNVRHGAADIEPAPEQPAEKSGAAEPAGAE
jgi:hypothetical protein